MNCRWIREAASREHERKDGDVKIRKFGAGVSEMNKSSPLYHVEPRFRDPTRSILLQNKDPKYSSRNNEILAPQREGKGNKKVQHKRETERERSRKLRSVDWFYRREAIFRILERGKRDIEIRWRGVAAWMVARHFHKEGRASFSPRVDHRAI